MSSLIVAGIGMKAGFHTTPEVRHAMETAETVLYLTNEPVSGAWIRKLRPDAEDLSTA